MVKRFYLSILATFCALLLGTNAFADENHTGLDIYGSLEGSYAWQSVSAAGHTNKEATKHSGMVA